MYINWIKKRTAYYTFYAVLFLCSSLSLSSQLDHKISPLITAPESQHAIYGISVTDQDGYPLYEYQSQGRLIPASTFKLITTLTAIELLGAAYQYKTEVGYTGELLDDGTLMGDLIVIGDGDPSLGAPGYKDGSSLDEVLQDMVGFVKSAGINCIEGSVLIDDSIFDRKPIHPSWAWDDLTNYYTSGAWGFNLHENLYYLKFARSPQPNQSTNIAKIEPSIPDLTFDNEVTTGPLNSGDNAYIYGDPYSNHRWVEGTIPPGEDLFIIKGAVPDPPLFGAYQLYLQLQKADIAVPSYGVGIGSRKTFKVIGTISSPPLSLLVAFANDVSNNMYCEAFFRTIAMQDGQQANYKNGQQAINNHIKDLGLVHDQIHIEDGSGLSSRNRISAAFMTSFINAKRQSLGVDHLQSYIPQAGMRGSVKNFLNGYKAQKGAWLKSGSINNVLAYAGLLRVKSGRIVNLSIMANGQSSNRNVRAQMEKMIEVFYEGL